MRIQFTQSGESPDIGPFEAGDERDIPADIAKRFIERGLASAVPGELKEVTDHGDE
jgi:hypothetical protein